MPMYEFVDEADGTPVERFYHMGQAPEIGAYIRGTKIRRVPSRTVGGAVDNLEMASNSFPAYQGCEFVKDGRTLHPTEIYGMRKEWPNMLKNKEVRPVKGERSAERYDKQGRPVFSGKQQVRDFAKRNGYEWSCE